jgi:hypothetical protein
MLYAVPTVPETPNGDKAVPAAFAAKLWFILGKDMV